MLLIRYNFHHSFFGARFKRSSYIIRHCSKKSSPKSVSPVEPSNLSQQHKTIDAKLVKPEARPNATLLRWRELSSKNFLLRFLLKRPIQLVEWIESPRESKENQLIRHGAVLLVGIFAFIVMHSAFLIFHLEKNEITDRYFFNTSYEEVYKLYEELLLEAIMKEYEGKFVPSSNPVIQNGDKILKKLIESNRGYLDEEKFDTTWSVVVIDDDVIFNYEIMSEKFIILSKKLTDLCENEHQLAYVIAHSLCHTILKHFREPLSNVKKSQQFKYVQLITLIRLINIFHPSEIFSKIEMLKPLNKLDIYVRDFFFGKYRKLIEMNGYHIELEQETERIALQLLSRACYDIREVEKFIKKSLKLVPVEQNNDPETLDRNRYFLQHKINDPAKLAYVVDNLDKFIRFRSSCGCVPLK